MDNIYIDYEQAVELGHKVKGEASEMNNILQSISEIQERLQPILDNSSDRGYLNAVTEQTKIMQKLAEVVDETGNFLVTVSNAYSTAADTNMSDMN